MLRMLAFVCLGLMTLAGSAVAQQARPPVSQCQAIASRLPKATFASFNPTGVTPVQMQKEEVQIRFLGHSTFLITSPAGVSIATDYNGWYTRTPLPTVVTMNRAHSTHYTLTPDPAIEHVLHGWSDVPGQKAEHRLPIGDVYIRNVSTDIRNLDGLEQDGNSIFIFEIAGLCIGHLGHLHFELTDSHYTEIGRLDVLMVPVDGGLTMGADSMSRVVQRLRSALILPMHRTGPPLDRFLTMFDGKFDVRYSSDDVITVSMRNLPKKPTILVPKGL